MAQQDSMMTGWDYGLGIALLSEQRRREKDALRPAYLDERNKPMSSDTAAFGRAILAPAGTWAEATISCGGHNLGEARLCGRDCVGYSLETDQRELPVQPESRSGA